MVLTSNKRFLPIVESEIDAFFIGGHQHRSIILIVTNAAALNWLKPETMQWIYNFPLFIYLPSLQKFLGMTGCGKNRQQLSGYEEDDQRALKAHLAGLREPTEDKVPESDAN